MFTQKVEDKFVFTTNFDPDFKAEVAEKGVYTYRYNLYEEEGKVYFNFQLLLWDELVFETGAIDLEPWAYATPLADHAYAVRSVWFTGITVANGVNVYKELPVNPNAPVENPDEEYEVPDTACYE